MQMIVLVTTPSPDALDRISIYERLMEKSGQKLKGVVLNMCDDPAVKKLLESGGTKVLGCIPTIRELGYLTVSEIMEALNAEVLAGEGGLEKQVERVMVGGMTAESALREMRRLSKKAMITGGDRADMLMAALSTDTSCLILTGGLRPANPVIVKAEELNVPVLLIGHGTQVTAEIVDHLIARISPNDMNKIELVADLVHRYVDLSAVWS